MLITLTGEQLLRIADSAVLATLSREKLQPIGAYRLSRVAALVMPEATRMREARNRLLTPENSTEIAPGMLQLRLEYAAEFTAALGPLLIETITLDLTRPITLDDLKGATVSADDISALGPLLEVKE